MIHIGFTGTREGLWPQQRKKLAFVLAEQPLFRAHHGDCVGADAQFHDMCVATQLCEWIVVHPGSEMRRAYKSGTKSVICEPLDDLARNRAIVRVSDRMVACPIDKLEHTRSGTWYTIRQTRKVMKPLCVVWPDGTIDVERW